MKQQRPVICKLGTNLIVLTYWCNMNENTFPMYGSFSARPVNPPIFHRSLPIFAPSAPVWEAESPFPTIQVGSIEVYYS